MLERETQILFDAIIRKESIESLTKIISTEIFDNPVLITNAYFKVISKYSSGDFSDPVWNYVNQNNNCEKAVIESFRKDEKSVKTFTSKKPFIYNKGVAEKIPRILCRINCEKDVYGCLTVFQVNHPLTKIDIQKAEIVSQTLGVVLFNDLSTDTPFESFYRELLDFNEKNRLEVELEIRHMAPFFKKAFQIISAKKDNINSAYATYLSHEINTLESSIVSFVHENEVLIVINFDNDLENKRILEELIPKLEENHFTIGISLSFEQLIRFKQYAHQARKARELGPVINKDQNIFSYQDYVNFDLMDRCSQEELESLICKEYTRLKEYDEKNNGELLKTCIAYVDSGLNIAACAQQLHVHRNTLVYRLKNIEKVGGFSITDVKRLLIISKSQSIELWMQKRYK